MPQPDLSIKRADLVRIIDDAIHHAITMNGTDADSLRHVATTTIGVDFSVTRGNYGCPLYQVGIYPGLDPRELRNEREANQRCAERYDELMLVHFEVDERTNGYSVEVVDD